MKNLIASVYLAIAELMATVRRAIKGNDDDFSGGQTVGLVYAK